MRESALKIVGDPEKTAREAVEREKEQALAALDEARRAALRLVDDAYEKSLYEAERRVRDEVQRAEEQLKSLVSVLELQLKSRVAEVKTRYVDEAIRRALEELRKRKVGADWYEAYLESVIRRIAEESEGEMLVRVAPEDRDLASRILERLGVARLRLGDPVEIVGGAIGESPDGSVRLDYSLDLLVKMESHRLRGVAAAVLFRE